MLTDLYIAGSSPLHRMAPVWKLALLFAFCTALFLMPSPLMLAAGGILACLGYGVAGLSLRHAYDAFRPALYMLAIIFAAQLWLADLATALYFTLRFVWLLMAAGLVTYTTRASEFTDGILSALRFAPAWVPRDKIALAMSLVWRFIPMVRKTFDEVREAQAARGLDRNMRALMVPIVVRTLKNADEIAEAITARSLDD